jgi:RNA polymerase sigma factor (sigma-70 family)
MSERPRPPGRPAAADAEDLAALVARAQRGEGRAVEAVLAAVRDDVHRLALRMTGCPDDALDATQEILVKVLTRLSTFTGEAAFTTWAHRVAVNHLLDRKRSAVERLEYTFGTFADDLHDGLTPVAANAGPELDLLAREVKHGCTLALLTCLDREARVAYVLGEVFGMSSREGAWVCETTEAAYRKRLSRARAAVRAFVGEHCGLVAPTTARCHCRKRVPVAVRLGRVDPEVASGATPAEVEEAIAEMEALYDTAGLLRSVPDALAPGEVAVRIRSLLDSGRYRLVSPPP